MDAAGLDSPPPPDLAAASDLAAGPDLAKSCGDNVPILGSQHNSTTMECSACVAGACCAERAACGNDTDCLALRKCFQACSAADDSSCLSGCSAMFAKAAAANRSFVDCRSAKCALPCADLSCLGNVKWPAPAMANYTAKLRITDSQSAMALPDAKVRLCPRTDPTCAKPVSTLMSDGNGDLELTAAATADGIDVYLEITRASYFPVLSYSVARDPARYFTSGLRNGVGIPSVGTINLLAGSTGIAIDPNRGHASLTARDCTTGTLADVAVSASTGDGSTRAIYFAGDFPSAAAKATDPSGFALLLNVPVGTTRLIWKRQSTGQTLGSFEVFIRAGAITALRAPPTP